MTLPDHVGKAIAKWMYRRARTNPGRPMLMNYENVARAGAFGSAWPWSWRKDGRGSYRTAFEHVWKVSTSR